ncbi:hypothetical protein P4123_00685 [Pseudomonas aeruginosa]|nr:hypothetical protein [Pseudomonas aeruginosa]
MARWLNAYFLTDSLERTGNALTWNSRSSARNEMPRRPSCWGSAN